MRNSRETFEQLNKAIKMGVKGDSSESLFANIAENGTFFVILKKGTSRYYDLNKRNFLQSDQYLEDLVLDFPAICEKYNVIPLPGKTEFAKRTVIAANEEIVYEFHVNTEDMHRILMNESEDYAGYHSLGSVLLLVDNPDIHLLKPTTICVSPVLPLDENRFILRNAGCNFIDTLATQISFLVRQYIDPSIPVNQCFGHKKTPVLENILMINAEGILWDIALEYLNLNDSNELYFQSIEGLSEIHLQEDKQNFVVEIDRSALEIYTQLGAGSPDELAQLKSLEIPTIDYLNLILKHQKQVLKKSKKDFSSAPKQSKPGFFRDQDEISQDIIGLRRGIDAIQKICHELQSTPPIIPPFPLNTP